MPKAQTQSQDRNRKGTVGIESVEDRGLRLRWSHNGKRYTLALGLPDSKVNHQAAKQKATQIELDIASGNFDPTLQKYKPATERTNSRTKISCVLLFEQFTAYKAKFLDPRTIDNYQGTLNCIQGFFKDKPAEFIGLEAAESFAEWMRSEGYASVTLREKLVLMRACWDWGMQTNRRHVEYNPWAEVAERTKVAPKQRPKPFSREEMGAILHAFRTNRYYNHYADYVEYLFGTGCRTSEAIGLRWKDLTDDCTQVWIGESLSQGVRKSTKTNRARTVSLTPRLIELLLARRPENPAPDDLVFLGAKGAPIDAHNFRNRAWISILKALEIDYRKPYTTRSTLISHALDLGMNPIMVSELTGHDPRTLFKNYAGNVSSRPRLPEL